MSEIGGGPVVPETQRSPNTTKWGAAGTLGVAVAVTVVLVVFVVVAVEVYTCSLQPPPHLAEELPEQATLQSEVDTTVGFPPENELAQ
jgi:uncharacterized membrane protein YedE/YeeE